MTITVLAVLFLVFVVLVAFAGSRFLSSRSVSGSGAGNRGEQCAICRKRFDKGELVLREIGDVKLLYFCRECILKLHADLGGMNIPPTSPLSQTGSDFSQRSF